MRLFRHSKKADLNLSVQAIVILIFAVIMLGLGLGLINFIFGSAREKVSQSLSVTELAVQPTTDKPVTIETKVSVKFKDQKNVQIGFYNFKSQTLYTVTPKIAKCVTSKGAPVDAVSLPVVPALSKDKVDAGTAEAWGTILNIESDQPTGDFTAATYTGTLAPGNYICSLGVYACSAPGCVIDPTKDLIKSADFTLEVTS